MNIRNSSPISLGLVLSTIAMSGSMLLSMPALQASSQRIFQRQSTLRPMQEEHSFTGQAGQAVTINMSSDDFDTLLTLVGPNGQELAVNDDYARSLNSTIVITLPQTGSYQLLARSFSGMGGDYTLNVTPATPYDIAYSRAAQAMQEGNVEAAIAGYTEAIRIDPNQAITYLDRAETRYSQANIWQEDGSMNSDALSPELRQLIVADYLKAAELYDQAGDSEMAHMSREQADYIQNF